MNFTGDGFVLFSAIAYGVSSVLIKKYSAHEDPVVISGYQFIAGGIVMIIIGALCGGAVSISGGKAVAVLGYLSCLSAVAYSLWGVLLKHNPVSGVLLSNLLLAEQSNVSPLNLIITLALVSAGIIMLNYKKD